jgi:hypothetical protein
MISISLHDPGMHPKVITAETREDVPAALEPYNRTYTTAILSENGRPFGHAKREVGERNWIVRTKG